MSSEDVSHALAAQTATPYSSRPYPPSWIDRLTGWVRTLPISAWALYLAFGLVLGVLYFVMLRMSPQWSAGLLKLDAMVFYSSLNGMTVAYLLGLAHYLDNSAEAALARFRPVLLSSVTDAEYNRLLYRLTTLPARPTVVATLAGLAYTAASIAYNFYTSTFAEEAFLEISPSAIALIVLVVGFNALLYVLVAVLVYHSLHQLSMVNEIYTKHTRINLFQLGPLYALSGITARTAVGIGVPTYIWYQANTIAMSGVSASDIVQTVVLGVLSLVTFAGPLLGAHNRLEREKQRLQDDVAGRIESTIAKMHSHSDQGEPQDYAALKAVLDGLMAEQGVVEKLRTWPWRVETVRGLGVAFFLPVFIWVVQRVLERLGL